MLAMREDVANCISDQSSTHKTIGNGDYHGVLMLLVLGVFVFCFFFGCFYGKPHLNLEGFEHFGRAWCSRLARPTTKITAKINKMWQITCTVPTKKDQSTFHTLFSPYFSSLFIP